MKGRVRPGLPRAGARGDGPWTLAMSSNWPNTPLVSDSATKPDKRAALSGTAFHQVINGIGVKCQHG